MKGIKSNIAIDLGSKYTGVISESNNGNLDKDGLNAIIVCMPEDSEKFKYLQKERTANRHRVRALDRYKKARRLTLQIISYEVKRALLSKEEEAISSFIKRRGYNRLEAELDFDALEGCSLKYFADNFGELFNEKNPLVEQVKNVFLNPESSGSLRSSIESAKLYKELYAKIDLKKIKDEVESDFSSDTKKALKLINNVCDEILSASEFGHKHRKEYFKDILHDLKRDSRLNDLKNLISVEKLHKIICNISNLQLRALRWYFDDPAMEVNNEFNAEKFRNVWVRAYQFFHYKIDKSNEKTEKISLEKRRNINNFILQLQKTDNVVEVLANVDPELTIPPYENMDNRDPVVDRTLLLNPDALDRQFPQWTRFVDLFVSVLPEISSDLDEILATTDRKSLKNAKDQRAKKIKLKKSYILQRIFDLSKSNHSILSNIRLWSQDLKNTKVLEFNDFIKKNFDENDCLGFLNLAKRYYEECYQAKVGLWSLVDDPLLEMSNLHPRKKNKVKKEIIQSILAIDNNFDFNLFEEIWKKPFGKLTLNDLCSEDAKLFKAIPKKSLSKESSVCSICKKIEQIRKDYGNTFNFYYTKVKGQIERDFLLDDFLDKLKNYVDQEADFKDVYIKSRILSSYLVKKLNLNELDNDRYANPYILSQLYNVLETDTGGFASNVLSVIQENQWRMGSFASENCARCSRLVAESVRPFDGALAKFLDRLAYEIAKRKVKELKRFDLKDSEIEVTILIEENKFDSSSSFDQIKKTVKVKNNKTKIVEPWKIKDERIKNASKGICAYTGQFLDRCVCEIDHIIPRSESKKLMGTIFNSEANLIYVSQKGNQIKKDHRLGLYDLDKNYLYNIFGTSNINEIENKIRDTIKNLVDNNRNFIFDSMSEDERQCVRHALFMHGDPVYYNVLKALSKLNSTLVNGTQAFLVKLIAHKIKQGLKEDLIKFNNTIKFNAFKVDCNDSHFIRERLGEKYSKYKKKEFQAVTSHSIDALCVLASALDDSIMRDCIVSKESDYRLSDPDELAIVLDKIKNFELCLIRNKSFFEKDLIEDKGSVEDQGKARVLSRTLYKDSIYAEHFIPVLTKAKIVAIGFNWSKNEKEKSRIDILKGADEFLKIVSPFFTEEYRYREEAHTYRIDKLKAFEFMHDKASSTDIFDVETLKCLYALCYTTKNKDISDLLFKKDTIVKESEVLKDNLFNIKLDLNIKKKFSIKGKIILPEKHNWKNLLDRLYKCASKDFVGYLSQNDVIESQENFSSEDKKDFFTILSNYFAEKRFLLEQNDSSEDKQDDNKKKKTISDLMLFNKYLKDKLVNKNNRSVNKHVEVKRKFSLPVLDAPSGGIRIRRYDKNFRPIYQLSCINKEFSKGFAFDDQGNIDWGRSVVCDIYSGKNQSSSVIKRKLITERNYQGLDTELCLYKDHLISVSMKIASEARPVIIIEMPFVEFINNFKECLLDDFNSIHDIDAVIKVNKTFEQQLQSLIKDDELKISGPRDDTSNIKISVLRLGKNIKFMYESKGNNITMKKFYSKNLKDGIV